MINKIKDNTKIKLISLLSAIVLWLYVMAIVDPEETKLFENVPVTITNKSELKEKDLVVYPETELTTNIYVTGKLSNIKKVTKDDISVYGEIKSPMEGNNDIYLKVSTSQRVSCDFKNPVMIVTLEKIVDEPRAITINKEGSGKNNVDTIKLENDIDKVTVSGPRTLVNEVKEVVGTVNIDGKAQDFSQKITLQPVDSKGKVVDGVALSQESVTASITLLTQKVVPIQLKVPEDAQNIDISKYVLSQSTVTIRGKKDLVDSIKSIDTQPINISEISNGSSKDIYLQVPEGITIETKYITIKKNTEDNTLSEFTYVPEDIEIRNNTNNIDVNKIKIPDSVKVNIEYLANEGTINKEDIKLYIDLNELSTEDNICKIKSESKYEIKKINIEPDSVVVEMADI